jgi:hypothetical protein
MMILMGLLGYAVDCACVKLLTGSSAPAATPAIKVRRDIGCFMMISFTVVMSISTGDRKISVTQKRKEWTVMNRAAFSHFMS